MSNTLAEATNTHIRLLTRRAYGYHSVDALIAMATPHLRRMLPGTTRTIMKSHPREQQ